MWCTVLGVSHQSCTEPPVVLQYVTDVVRLMLLSVNLVCLPVDHHLTLLCLLVQFQKEVLHLKLLGNVIRFVLEVEADVNLSKHPAANPTF